MNIKKKLPTVVLETTASRLEGGRSIQLSYAGICLSDRNRTSDQQISLVNFYSLSLYQLSYAEC